MNPEDIGKILDEIGERIGPAGEYAFTLAVRQQIIVGVLWTMFVVALIVVSATVLIRCVGRIRRIDVIAAALTTAIEKQQADSAEITKAVADFRREKEAADLEAMTPEARWQWFDLQSKLFGFGSYYGGSSLDRTARDTQEVLNTEQIPYMVAATISGLVLVIACYSLIGAIQPLLNPEWKAIQAVIGLIR